VVVWDEESPHTVWQQTDVKLGAQLDIFSDIKTSVFLPIASNPAPLPGSRRKRIIFIKLQRTHHF